MKFSHTTNGEKRVSSEAQFSLTNLLEFVTGCAILSALAPAVGVPSSVCLMLMTLALAARFGFLAYAMFVAAFLATLGAVGPDADLQIATRQVLVTIVAGLLPAWFSYRRRHAASPPSPPTLPAPLPHASFP